MHFFNEATLTALGIAIKYACKHTNCLALIFSGHILSAYVDTWHEGDSKIFLVRGVLNSELLLKKPILAVKVWFPMKAGRILRKWQFLTLIFTSMVCRSFLIKSSPITLRRNHNHSHYHYQHYSFISFLSFNGLPWNGEGHVHFCLILQVLFSRSRNIILIVRGTSFHPACLS